MRCNIWYLFFYDFFYLGCSERKDIYVLLRYGFVGFFIVKLFSGYTYLLEEINTSEVDIEVIFLFYSKIGIRVGICLFRILGICLYLGNISESKKFKG